MKKIITIIIIIIAVGVAYWLLRPAQPPLEPEPESKDEISTLLENLKQETGINFSDIKDIEFNWITEVDPKVKEVNVQGKGFEVERISDEQYRSIESFFKDDGFEVDMYNITSGTVVESIGYKKNKIVCRVIAGATGYKEATGQWIPPEWDKNDVDVKCGKTGDLIEAKNGEDFSITLEANPTTGYEWQVDFDSIYLELIERKYIPGSSELVGSGGEETFNFLALKSGTTEIIFSYLRLWESVQPIEKKVYEIIIK